MVDHKKVEQAIRLLLEGIGEDPDREGLAETPDRIARMYEEICGGMNEDAAEHLKKTFTTDMKERHPGWTLAVIHYTNFLHLTSFTGTVTLKVSMTPH